jgi:hypothetical protein
MKLPRDLGGEELAALLGRYGYQIMLCASGNRSVR